MEINALWTVLCNLLFVLLASSRDVNRNKSHRFKKELTLSPLYPNLIRSTQVQHDKNYEGGNGIINDGGDEEAHSSNSSFSGASENYSVKGKPSYYSYIKRGDIYTNSSNTNKSLNDSNKLNTISNTFIQNSNNPKTQIKPTEIIPPPIVNQESPSPKQAPPKSTQISNTTDNIDYFDISYENNSYLISQLSPHYSYIYFFDEFKHYASYHKEIQSDYDNIHNSKVKSLLQEVSKAINSCNKEKNELKELINILENPQMLKTQSESYDVKLLEYENKKQAFTGCLVNKNQENVLQIKNINNEIRDLIEKLTCSQKCETKVYFDMIKTYLVEFKKMPYENYNTFIKQYKNSYHSGIDMIRKIEKQIDNPVTINSIKFTQKEMEYIIDRFEYHLEKAKHSIDQVTTLFHRVNLTHVIKNRFKDHYFNIGNNYSIYRLSKDSLNMLYKALIHKEEIIHNLLGELTGDLEKKISKLLDSEYSITESNNIILQSEETLKFGEDAYNKNIKLIEDLTLYPHLEINKFKKDYEDNMNNFRQNIMYIQSYVTSIKNAYEYNVLEKNFIENKQKNIPSNCNAQEKVDKLLNIIDSINYRKLSVTDNLKKMKDSYKEIEKLKIKIQELIVSIEKKQQHAEELIKKEKEIDILKEDTKNTIEYIKGIIEKIKELISVNKDFDKNFQQVEKLINEALYNKDQFEHKKKDLHTKMKEILHTFHAHDLQIFLDDLSQFLKEQEALYQNADTKEKLDQVIKTVKEKQDKLREMKCDDIPNIIENLKKESLNILNLKDDVINKQFENMRTELPSSLDEMTKEYNALKSSIEEYEAEKKKIENHKQSIIKRKNIFIVNKHEKDEDVQEGKNTYSEFISNKETILKRESPIRNQLNVLKEKRRNIKTTLQTYRDAIQKLETYTEKKDTEAKMMLEKLNTQMENFKINEAEKSFNDCKSIISNTINEVENENKNIDTIKRVNIAMKRSTINKESVEQLIRNKDNLLKEKIEKHFQKINIDKLIGQSAKENMLNNLEREKVIINQKLNDSRLNDLKLQIEKTLSYCEKSRENIKGNNGTHPEELNESEIDWESAKGKIEILNSNYQALNKITDDIINKQYDEIIVLIDREINWKGKDIEFKIEKRKHALEKMEAKLSSFDTSEDVKKYQSEINKEELKKVKEMSTIVLNKIDQNKNQLINIKTKPSGYVEEWNGIKNKKIESNKEKDKQIVYNTNRSDIEKVYKNISDMYNELDNLEKEETTSHDVDNIEMQYDRLLINFFVQKINEENAKAKELMKEINSHIGKIDKSIQAKTFNERRKEATAFEFSQYHQISLNNSKKIAEIVQHAVNKKGEAERSKETNEVKSIKNEVNTYLQQVIDEYNSMQRALGDIKNVNDLLISTDGKGIYEKILKSTNEAANFEEQAQEELDKMSDIINEIEKEMVQATEHKNNIHINLEDKQIDEEVYKIRQIQEEVTNKKIAMYEHLNRTKVGIENCLSQVRNAKRGKIKIDFLNNNKKNNILKDINIRNVNKNVSICMVHAKEVNKIEDEAKKEHDLFLEHEEDINRSLIIGIETKSKKRKNEATEIMAQIKEKHSIIKTELQQSSENLKLLNEKYNLSEEESIFANPTSTQANESIQYNIRKVKQNLLYIDNIAKEIDTILTNAQDSIRSISEISKLDGNSTLQMVEKEAEDYVKYLEKITKEKELMQYKRKDLDLIKSDIENIETELKKHRKLFETGLLNKISEIAKMRKLYIDSAEQLLNSSVSNFATLFNGFNLKKYKIETNLDVYKRKINEFRTEFLQPYESIQNKEKSILDPSIDFSGAKNLREEAQKEEKNIENIEKRTKKYLSDIKKMESITFIRNMRQTLDELNETFKQKYAEVEGDHAEIKKITEDIKNLNDESSSSTKLQQAEDKNSQMKAKANHYSLMNEAHAILEQIVKSANFVGIKIVTELQPSDLVSKARLQEAPGLQFEPQDKVTLESGQFLENTNELDIHENVQAAYNAVLQIYKYSDDIDRKKEECEQLVKNGKDICLKIKSINEIKVMIQKSKDKESALSAKVSYSFTKLSELYNIKFNDENSDAILETPSKEELKKLRDAFNEEKGTIANLAKLNSYKTDFESHIHNLNDLAKIVDNLKASETLPKNIEETKTSINLISTKFGTIEKEIESINSSFDQLLQKGKKCEMIKYKLVRDNLSTKINDNSAFIKDIQKKATEYLTYIQNNYISIFKDIDMLNENLDGKSVSTYAKTKIEEANDLSAQLTAAVIEYKGIANSIRKEFIDINEHTEIGAFENSVKMLKDQYDDLINKKNSIIELHNKINLTKLREIRATSDKYVDIAVLLGEVVQDQRKKLQEAKNELDTLKDHIEVKEKELIKLDSSSTLVSIKEFDEIYDNIKYNVEQLHRIEVTNINELKKGKAYEENVSHLLNRRAMLRDDLQNYEEKDRLENKNVEMSNEDNNQIRQTSEVIKKLEKEFQNLLKIIQQNNNICSNNNIKHSISDILKNVETIRERFVQNYPEREKYHQIEINYNDIKGIVNEVATNPEISIFTENINTYIQQQIRSAHNSEDAQTIKDIIEDVTNNYRTIISKLPQVNNALDRIQIKKNDMDTLFESLSKENVNNYNSAKNFIDDSDKTIKHIADQVSKMSNLINYAEREIKELEEKMYSILNRPVIDNSASEQDNLSSDTQGNDIDEAQKQKSAEEQDNPLSDTQGNDIDEAQKQKSAEEEDKLLSDTQRKHTDEAQEQKSAEEPNKLLSDTQGNDTDESQKQNSAEEEGKPLSSTQENHTDESQKENSAEEPINLLSDTQGNNTDETQKQKSPEEQDKPLSNTQGNHTDESQKDNLAEEQDKLLSDTQGKHTEEAQTQNSAEEQDNPLSDTQGNDIDEAQKQKSAEEEDKLLSDTQGKHTDEDQEHKSAEEPIQLLSDTQGNDTDESQKQNSAEEQGKPLSSTQGNHTDEAQKENSAEESINLLSDSQESDTDEAQEQKSTEEEDKLLSDIQWNDADEAQERKSDEEQILDLSKQQMHSNEGNKNYMNTTDSTNGEKQTEEEESQNEDHSQAGGTHSRVRLAGGIILGLSVFSGAVYISFRNKDKGEENKDPESIGDQFEDNDIFNADDKEEVIEVCFENSDYPD
ncbi:reticulocyte binding protein 2b (PcyRBP2b) putative [Plasmodium cynomolgi strain B]|uniref:Reticulocyte binding protein 2b (PcyRBP2b) putative n=1 Tax=Plasmodium cynomolgi (strain B) TaxID=1120755 RepID=K6UUQ6_PLACD|nr:reticulocyte binding protein 2b (PcyRBP2b) putative [Plasmodium cynomolgi strain B]GAB65945.1 reticulocyte binding protein 2b (PcyRBP2b) putative [Plasmodium cynomolgi strain B]